MSTSLRFSAKHHVIRQSVYQQIADDLSRVFDPFYSPIHPAQMHVVQVMGVIARSRQVHAQIDKLNRDFFRIAEDLNHAAVAVGPVANADD